MSDGIPAAPRRLDLVLAVVMALAAVGTAWAGFQSAKWSGVQAIDYAAAGAERTKSNRSSTKAGQQRVTDVVTFTSWLNALNQEIVDDPSARPRGEYEPDPDAVSGFLFQRFRDEFRPAVHAWLATRPLVDPDAPATPFAMSRYRLAEDARARLQERRADRLSQDARTANQRSDNYVLTAVVFALVLFFAGLAGRTTTRRAPQYLLSVLAAVALLFAAALLLTFPVTV
ncbi:hypothetical protein [Streptomyces sp. MAR4 CNX-425]|uniref:hypothetical protein n=1 Tax=Streptomyces sp. MAR4 CNX-425 TaxID=3406343 RepID=UPI003B503794